MAELFIRNCMIPSSQVPVDVRSNTGGRRMIWLAWEILRLAGWAEQWKDADVNWTACERFSPVADGAVNSANPLVITSDTAGFVSNGVVVGDVVSVEGSLGQNLGMYRIADIVSDTEIIIDAYCRPAVGWVTETGLTLKVHTAATKSGEQITDATEVCMNPPAGTQQVHFSSTTSKLHITTYPKGDVTTKGTGTATTTSNVTQDSTADRPRVNAYVNDQNAFIYIVWWINATTVSWSTWFFGELEDVAASDIYPGFYAHGHYSAANDYPWDFFASNNSHMRNFKMLDAGSTVPQEFRTVHLKSFGAVSEVNRRGSLFNCRLLEGGAPRRKIPYWTIVGASPMYRRGVAPIVRSTYDGWEKMRPFDPAGQWVHTRNGVLLPRGGPGDPIIIEACDQTPY